MTGSVQMSETPVRLWNVADGRLLKTIYEKDAEVCCPTLSPDGQHIVATGEFRKLHWTNLITSQVEYGEDKEVGGTRAIAFSPDGKLLALNGFLNERNGWSSIQLWDTSTREMIRKIKYQMYMINALAFTPDGTLLASAAGDINTSGAACLWEVKTGKLVCTIWEGKHGIMSIACSPDGKQVAAGGGDSRQVLVWDIDRKKIIQQWKTDNGVYAIAYALKGKLLAHGNSNAIDLRDPESGKLIRRIRNLGSDPVSLAFSPDGRTLYSASAGQQAVQRWEVASGNEIDAGGHTAHVQRIQFTRDGKKLLSHAADNSARVWDLASRSEQIRYGIGLNSYRNGAEDHLAVLSPDGKELVGLGRGGVIECWSVSERKRSARFLKLPGQFPDIWLDWSRDGKFVVSAEGSGIRVWSRDSEKSLRHFGLPSTNFDDPTLLARYYSLAFLYDDTTLVAAGMDGFLHYWNYHKGTHLDKIPSGHNSWVGDLKLSEDGRFLVSLGHHGAFVKEGHRFSAHVWEVVSGERVATHGGTEVRILSAALAPDNVSLATAALNDPVVRLTSLIDGKQVATFKGHVGHALCLAFSPDGATLASGGLDTTILLWDIRKKVHAPEAPPEAKWEQLWKNMAASGIEAQAAVLSLAAAGDRATTFLRNRLHPWPEARDEAIRKHLADLDSRTLAVRTSAEAELARLGKSAEKAIRADLAGNPALDKKRALERLLDGMGMWVRNSTALRDVRALQVLERVGSPDAMRLLKELASGPAEARLTREAKITLDRMGRTAKALKDGKRP